MPVQSDAHFKGYTGGLYCSLPHWGFFRLLLLLQHLPHTPSVRHGVSLPSTGDDACVSLVRQDLKLLVSYRTKRNFPSPPAKNFPCSSATLTLIWSTVKWSFGQAHGIFVESASAPQNHWVRVVTILSSSS